MIRAHLSLALAGLVSTATAAVAQTAPTPPMPAAPSALSRPVDAKVVDDGATPVAQRQRADYAPAGVRMGSFLLYPGLLTSVAYDDNIYATSNRRVSDGVTRIQPSVLLRSDWNVHSLDVYGVAEGVFHGRHTAENQVNGALGLRGVIDVQRDLRIGYFAGWTRSHEDRGSGDSIFLGTALDKPLASDKWTGGLSLNKSFNRFRLSVAGQYEGVIYQDGTVAGVRVDQSVRDYSSYTLRTRLGYEISPLTQVFSEVGYERRVYPHGYTDSNSVRAIAGLSIEASRLVNGEIYGGYLGRNYDSSLLADINTWTMGANLNWLVTPLLTMTFLAERSIGEDFSSLVANSATTTTVAMRADYELMRNVILRAQVGHEWAGYKATSRNDRTWKGQLSVIYMLNRNLHFSLDYKYADRDSNIAAYDYRRNIAGGSLRVQF